MCRKLLVCALLTLLSGCAAKTPPQTEPTYSHPDPEMLEPSRIEEETAACQRAVEEGAYSKYASSVEDRVASCLAFKGYSERNTAQTDWWYKSGATEQEVLQDYQMCLSIARTLSPNERMRFLNGCMERLGYSCRGEDCRAED